MTLRSAVRRYGREWGRKVWRTAHTAKGERLRAQRDLAGYVRDRLREEMGQRKAPALAMGG